MGQQWEPWQTLFSWAPESLQMVTAAMKSRPLLLGRKAMTNLDRVLKSRDITLLKKVPMAKAMVYPIPQYKSINPRCSAFFIVQLPHPYMTTGKTTALTRWTCVVKVMSLLFNTLTRFVISFLPRSKRLLISWLLSPPAVILEPKKIKSVTVSTVSPSICHEVMGPDAMILVSECWVLSQLFHSPVDIQGWFLLGLTFANNLSFLGSMDRSNCKLSNITVLFLSR